MNDRAAGSASERDSGAETLRLPEPPGPHAVGVTDVAFTDEARAETFQPGAPRRLMVRMWYPAERSQQPRKAYMTAEEYALFGDNARRVMPFPEAFEEPQRHAEMHAQVDAEPTAAAGLLPTVVFSHGAFAHVNSNVALAEHLASLGYLVASVAHPYLSSAVIYPDGAVTTLHQEFVDGYTGGEVLPTLIAFGSSPDVGARLAAQRRMTGDFLLARPFLDWRDDMVATADAIARGGFEGVAGRVAAQADLGKLAYVGMSFGCAAVSAAHVDPRAKAAVNLDGANFDLALVDADVRTPLLILHSDFDLVFGPMMPGVRAFPNSEFSYERLATMGSRPDVIRRVIAGAAHIDLTDRALFPAAIRAQQAQLGLAGAIDGSRLHAIINDYVAAFLDRHLLDVDLDFPNAQDRTFPEVSPVDLSYMRASTATV